MINPSSGPMGHLRNSESLETTLFLPRVGLLPLSRRDLSAMGRTFSRRIVFNISMSNAVPIFAEFLTQERKADDLRSLLMQLRTFFSLIPKAKTAKIVRGIIDAVVKRPGTPDLQISLCKEMVE
ncbi:26S proteasome non-atpase regulatory subunit [Musa troglodytarum]|uniref:26S proteasome non-atpase regulatory subunit n=1 Tax=Musa troglodytarum TaxID=320322 RepID=A0A9E7K760_9LILI|nr:26S proteasome non-atpase regulatory subunit [Musa troglodytarum]